MMRSLRGRHLVNGVVIIITGILVLGALLSLSIYQSRTDAVAEELERTALDLLGYIEYDQGSFLITEPNTQDSAAFLNERGLLTNGKKRFAYIWDVEQQKVIWDSLDNNDVDQQSVKDNFALFDFDALLQSIDGQGQGFSPAKAQKMNSLPVSGEAAVQYMVAAQKFALKIADGRKDYLFITATSIADIETDIYGLIKILVTLLLVTVILLIITQLLFSWWVMKPIKKLEQEIAAVASGKKALLNNDYPNELQAIQDSINTILNAGKQK